MEWLFKFNKIIFLFLFFVIAYSSKSQQEEKITLTNDTINVEYESKFETNNLIPDKFYFIVGSNRFNYHWKVFNESNPKILLLEFQCKNDSCITNQYYNNYQLKRKIIETSLRGLIYEELWCDNGQLIRKVDYTNMPQQITNYYCNGKKKNEFTLDGYRAIGKHLWWFDNGQIEVEGLFDKEGQQSGLWKYYNESGNLIKTEEYESGKLIKTTK